MVHPIIVGVFGWIGYCQPIMELVLAGVCVRAMLFTPIQGIQKIIVFEDP